MITRARRRLLLAARALRDKGTVPPGVDNPCVYRWVRSGEAVMTGIDWREMHEERLQHLVRPVALWNAAE